MSDTFSSSWEHRVLWVTCQYEFLFTWMEPADGRVGFGLVQAEYSRKPRRNASLLEALAAFL